LISRALHPDVFDQPGKKLLFHPPAEAALPTVLLCPALFACLQEGGFMLAIAGNFK
jgi:hypothetical protein